MPTDLVPHDAIPNLADAISSPAVYWVLRYLQKAGFILNGKDVDERMVGILQRLTDLRLVDPAYAEPADGRPYLWAINGNGSRVLKHIETTPSCQETLRPRFRFDDRARTALASIPDRDQLKALLAVDALLAHDPASWPTEEVAPLGEDKRAYLLRVTPDLRAFLRVLDSGEIELFDLVQEETLRQFLEQHRAGVKVG